MDQTHSNVNVGSILISLLFGVAAGVIAYRYIDLSLTYTEFIAGSLAWTDEGKSKDIAMIFAFIFVTSCSLLLLSKFQVLTKFQAWVLKRYGDEIVKYFSIVLLYSSIPFAIWAGEQVLSRGIPNFELLGFSAWVVFGGVVATFIALRNNDSENAEEKAKIFITFSFILFLYSSLSLNMLTVILGRVGVVKQFESLWLIAPTLWLVGLFLTANKLRYFKYSAIFFQMMIVGYFSLIIPSPFITAGQLTYFPTTSLLFITVMLLILFSYYDIYKRASSHSLNQELSISLLSPFPFAALLILIFLSSTAMPSVSADDYHFGEELLPLYLVLNFHIIPYADYSFAHGFVDMLPAIGANLFLDGTASTYSEGERIIKSLIVVASFLIVYRYTGLLVALLLSILLLPMLMWYGMLMWYFIAVILSLVIMRVNAKKLGITFFLVSLITFFLAPGQGAVFIVAILPLVIFRAWDAKTIILNLKATGISFVVLIVLGSLMPWILDMIISAVNYVLENGVINFQAHGKAWNHSLDTSQTKSSLLIFEVVRTSWVFIPVFILVFWLRGYYRQRASKGALFYGLFTVFFILIMHKYSLGRIDSGFSRLGFISAVSIPLLFLSVYFLRFSNQKLARWTLLFSFWLGLLTPNYDLSPIAHAKQNIPNIGMLTDGDEIGLPNLGVGRTNEAHIERLLSIKKIVDQFLDKNETFVDMTNRSGLYFYLNRRMPIEAVPYNLQHFKMQQRSIDRLSMNPPPMAILKADNLNHDGLSVSIRTHSLYRWVMNNYIPVLIDNIIIGVLKNEVGRFSSRFPKNELPISNEKQLMLWDKAFMFKELQQLPISWGKSQKTLNQKMKIVSGIDFSIIRINNVKLITDEKFQVTGGDPFVVYDISQYKLAGKDAGLLSFDFMCTNNNSVQENKPRLEIYWSSDSNPMTESAVVRFNAHNGRVIVPLDALPRWLAARRIDSLRIDLQNHTDCKIFMIRNIKLNQRIMGGG